MQTFGERLVAARKAKGMTQEALAREANVARNTISNWEHGRTIPDIDSARRLSDVLGVELSRATVEPVAPTVEAVREGAHLSDLCDDTQAKAAPPELCEKTQTDSAASDLHNLNFLEGQKFRIRAWRIPAGAAAIVCAVLFFFLFCRTPAPDGGHAFDADMFSRIGPGEAGKASLSIDHRVWTESNGGTDYQMYDFTLTEQNGIGYSIARIETVLEGKTGATRTIVIGAADLAANVNPEIAPYGSVTLEGGHPKGEFKRLGLIIYGEDANGAPETFYHLIEF